MQEVLQHFSVGLIHFKGLGCELILHLSLNQNAKQKSKYIKNVKTTAYVHDNLSTKIPVSF